MKNTLVKNTCLKKPGTTLASATVILAAVVLGTGLTTPVVANQVETKITNSQAGLADAPTILRKLLSTQD